MLTNKTISPLPQNLKMVMETPDEVSCALRAGKGKTHFNTLGESGRVARGRVETLWFFLTACVWNARSRSQRAWPSATSSTGGGRGARAGALVCGDRMGSVSGDRVGSVCSDRIGRFCGDRTGRFCGDRMGSVSGNRVGRLICYTETRSSR